MQTPVSISYRDVEPSATLEAQIHERVAKLEEFFDRITSCHVVVEAPHRRHHQGNLYAIRITLRVPNREIVVHREPSEHHAHEDLLVTVRDAFKEARRQLQDYARELRGDVKHHEVAPHGRVNKLFRDQGYGFIETPDGRELYFHGNSLLDGSFDAIEVGEEVWFTEEEGEKGPQATSIRLVARHHHFVD
jgi:cold shock CspA family protein/ribosome-associated translation inhibitor RaiA